MRIRVTSWVASALTASWPKSNVGLRCGRGRVSSHNTADREWLAELADEQAALRRIATLVTRGVPPAAIFDAVTDEPTVFEFIDDLEARSTIRLLPYGLASAQAVLLCAARSRAVAHGNKRHGPGP